MQDRHRRIVEIFLLRTAGPYIRVRLGKTQGEENRSVLAPISDIEAPSPDVRFTPESGHGSAQL